MSTITFKHKLVGKGDLIQSKEWNVMGQEIERLEQDKLNDTGGILTGSLNITQDLDVSQNLNVENSLQVADLVHITNSEMKVANNFQVSDLVHISENQMKVENNFQVADFLQITNNKMTVKGATSLAVDNGNVGIGTNDPQAKLEISSEIGNQPGIILKSNSNSQSANLQEWQSPNGKLLAFVNKDGHSSWSKYKYAKIWDEKPRGTHAGNSVAGWNVRKLNKIKTNISGATLSGNQFTLPEGLYKIKIAAPARHINCHKVTLYCVTDNQYVLIGTNAATHTGSTQPSNLSIIEDVLSINSQKTYQVRHYIHLAQGHWALGGEATSAPNIPEIYTTVFIEQKEW